MSLAAQFAPLRTRELREMLEDDEKINHTIRCSEKMLFQRFAEGKTPLAEFLDSFLGSLKLQHIRMALVKKLHEVVELRATRRLGEPEEMGAARLLPLCGLHTAVVVPACCRSPVLLPWGVHANTLHRLQYSPFCVESLRPGALGRGPRWPVKPVRLQPLEVQQRRHPQAPP
ncbi:hypothetical protein EYF80_027703 [Liparis tanakae]|uniref:Uncharacterized protein n=1 Tax=Liparis tanakae TaxID=230148 RepID=A0A4Z2H928_9TELE|nr:hypothetical protein EYF80_027703 [Liparis tanakae]